MPVKKRATRRTGAGNFLKKVQNTPKVKSARKKVRLAEQKRKAASRIYKAAVKKESKRLAKKRR